MSKNEHRSPENLSRATGRLTALCAFVMLTVVAAGCATLVNHSTNSIASGTLGLYQVDPVIKQQNDGTAGKDGIAEALDLDNYTLVLCAGGKPVIGPDHTLSQCSSVNAYQAATNDDTGITRNRLEAILVRHSDLICSQTEAEIVGTNDLINFGLGETTTLLAGAGALVSGVTAARVLSGLAAMSNATRSQINEIFYENALKAAIVQSIDKQRASILKSIQSHSIDSKTGSPTPLSGYSTDDMIDDVESYHDSCSFYSGVNALTQQAQTGKAASGGAGNAAPASAPAAPAKPAPAKPAPSKAAPSKAAPSKAAPSKAAPSKAAPSKAAPSKAAPSQVAPSQVAPSQVAPSQVAPSQALRVR